MNIRKAKKKYKNNVEALLWINSVNCWAKTKTYLTLRKHFINFANSKLRNF